MIQTEELERTLQQLGKRPLNARIFNVDKTRVDLHVYVTDANGIVLFDSAGRDVGKDYRAWIDVGRTLAGQYGARTTLSDPDDPASAVMYVGAAIRERVGAGVPDEIVGMVGVGKPIAAFSPFIANAREKLVIVGVIAVAAFALLLLMVTVWLVRPFGLVTDLWRALRARPGEARPLVHSLRAAFLDMRDALAGKSYVDEYVAALTHEIKSPLAAIRGAAELLREPLPEDARIRFAGNVEEQVKRAQDLVERMLELSGLERRRALQNRDPCRWRSSPTPCATKWHRSPPGATSNCSSTSIRTSRLRGDRFLLQRALANLVLNAIEFSPREGTVTVDAHEVRGRIELTVRDHGPGLPDFPRARVRELLAAATGHRPQGHRPGPGLRARGRDAARRRRPPGEPPGRRRRRRHHSAQGRTQPGTTADRRCLAVDLVAHAGGKAGQMRTLGFRCRFVRPGNHLGHGTGGGGWPINRSPGGQCKH